MIKILCFGDSNTWGINPSGGRYNEVERWTALLDKKLANKWENKYKIIEAGQPNRTLVHNAPFSSNSSDEKKSGIKYLEPYLVEHQPDVVLIMLGTNDLKKRFNLTVTEISQGMYRLVKQALKFEYPNKITSLKVFIISPPPINEVGAYRNMYLGAKKKSRALSIHYSEIATKLGCAFFDAGTVVKSCPIEGVHWQKEQHSLFSDALAKEIVS